MDFHGMKRKRLQALCKKHGIPANLKNTEMADRLFLIFKGKDIEDPVGSENGGTEKDVEMIDLVSPSPVVEERSDFSAKISRISEDAMLGFETNLSLEITREDFGICGVEEGMKSELNKEQVAPDLVALEEFNNHLVEGEVEKLGDQTNLVEDVCGTGKTGNETEEQEDNAYNPEGSETEKLEDNANNPEVSNKKDLNLLLVSPEEFGNHMVEGEVEKLSDQTNLVEDVCGTGKAGAETEKQDDNDNSPEGCRRNYLNLSLVSCEEFGYPLIEGEAKKYDDFICVGDAVHNVGNERSEVDSMHLDLDAMDIDGKTNVTVEHFTNDVHASCEVNSSDLNIHEMVASGTATKNADRCEARFVSSPKMSITPALESIGFSPKLLSNSETEVSQYESNYSPETLKVDIEICDTKENIQIDVNKEQVGDNPEDVYEAPYVMKMNDEDLVQAPSEEFGNHLLEGEVEKLGEKNNIEDVCENGKGRDDAVERGDHNSPQGSNIKDVNVLHVSQQEFGYPLVEEIQKSDGNIYNDTTGTDEKTNLTSEHFADVVPNFPSSFKYSDGTPDQFLRTYPENEIKFIDLNIHQDICEEELKSPEKPGSIADPGECFGFSPKNLEVSVIEGFQAETYFNSSTLGDIGTCNMKASIQSDKMEKVEYIDDNQQVIHATSGVMVLNSEDLVQVASVEAGDHLLEGEVEKSGLMSDSEECIRFLPNNLELSANKGFQAETYFDPNTLGDAVATCNVEESLQGDQIEKEYSEEVLHMANELVLLQRSMEENNPVEGEITRLFDYSDDHEENGVTGAEDDKNQHYVKGDMASFENYLLNGFQSIDDAGGQNSDEKPGDYVPTIMPQPGEMKSCTINLQQNSASEDNNIFYPKLLELSMKKEMKIVKSLPVKHARDVLGNSDMKENIKIAKKEQVGSIISKSAFPKRQPLQDLQQN
uniref:Uncharacterized protein n=1 Tax=Cajanus cajan TaxID=3821 RepID=A0A151RTV0_CAJCA|nr:hypothetical protein KK1_032465 [Cajanus cajan]